MKKSPNGVGIKSIQGKLILFAFSILLLFIIYSSYDLPLFKESTSQIEKVKNFYHPTLKILNDVEDRFSFIDYTLKSNISSKDTTGQHNEIQQLKLQIELVLNKLDSNRTNFSNES